MKNGHENNFIWNFNDKNISIGLPTSLAGFYEPEIFSVGINNILIKPPSSTKNIYNVEFGIDKTFFKKKIVIQNTNNISGYGKYKKPSELNVNIINNNNNTYHYLLKIWDQV